MAENNGNDVLSLLTNDLVNDILQVANLSEVHTNRVRSVVHNHLRAWACLASAKQLIVDRLLEQHRLDVARFKEIEQHLITFEKALNP